MKTGTKTKIFVGILAALLGITTIDGKAQDIGTAWASNWKNGILQTGSAPEDSMNAVFRGMRPEQVIINSYYPLLDGNCWCFANGSSTTTEMILGSQNGYALFDHHRGRDSVHLKNDGKLYFRYANKDYLWCDFNAELNKSWDVFEPGNDSVPVWTGVLESRSDSVRVPAGMFRDVYRFHFKFNGSDNDWTEYYAPSVGPVKRIHAGFGLITYDLISWRNNDTLPARHLGECYPPTGITPDVRTASPAEPVLDVFPNPFSTSAVISFRVQNRASYVRIGIYDRMGREVLQLVDGAMPIGKHTVPLNAVALPAGVYYCRMVSDGTMRSRTIILVR